MQKNLQIMPDTMEWVRASEKMIFITNFEVSFLGGLPPWGPPSLGASLLGASQYNTMQYNTIQNNTAYMSSHMASTTVTVVQLQHYSYSSTVTALQLQ